MRVWARHIRLQIFGAGWGGAGRGGAGRGGACRLVEAELEEAEVVGAGRVVVKDEDGDVAELLHALLGDAHLVR